MKFPIMHMVRALSVVFVLAFFAGEAQAQFLYKWLDVGDFAEVYIESGAVPEGNPHGWEYPQIHRASNSIRGEGAWIGTTNWTDNNGNEHAYYLSRVGPRVVAEQFTFPISQTLYHKFERPDVTVNGLSSFDKVVIVDEVDPNLEADAKMVTVYNSSVGVTVTETARAYANVWQDEFHLIEYTFENTGNIDDDAELELEGQELENVFFWFSHRTTTPNKATEVGDNGQVWGKYNMVDIVGDGHEDYDFGPNYTNDFSAIWSHYGGEPNPLPREFSPLGYPNTQTLNANLVAPGDTIGRLFGGYFQGVMTLHADNAADDPTYDRMVQPYTYGWLDNDEPLGADGAAPEDYYRLGIMTREHCGVPGDKVLPIGGTYVSQASETGNEVPCGRMYPHYADRVEPSGEFWNPTADPSTGKQGGHSFTLAYGPYQMAPGDVIHVVEARGEVGLGYDAETRIGRTFVNSGGDDDLIIEYDADGDGTIECGAGFDYDTYLNGSECMTKNQWAVISRDSLFHMFYRARDVYEASNGFTEYPIAEPPHPPTTFSVIGNPDRVDLAWTPPAGGPARVGWEIYRTHKAYDFSVLIDEVRAEGPDTDAFFPPRAEDNMPYICVAGDAPDCLNPMLGPAETSFADTEVIRGTDYYYYIAAVGEPNPGAGMDPILGVPGGTPSNVALRSSRYMTQTYTPVNLKRPPGANLEASIIVPNPVNLGSEGGIRFETEDEVAFFDIPGECTISIYTETGELIQVIEHNDGSGDQKWNLTTRARQLLVSGIYIAVIETPEGERVFRKFTVIR